MVSLSENQRTILDIVRRSTQTTRSAITDQVNLTQQSVHRLVDQLIDQNLLVLSAAPRKGPGKPSPLIGLNPAGAYGLGILANTDSIVLCITDLSCRTMLERRLTLDMSERRAALSLIRHELALLLKDVDLTISDLSGLGFTMPGFFVGSNRAFNAPEPLEDWSLIDLRPELTSTFGLETQVENSATAGAVGEALDGIGKKFLNFAYLGFDYGFGGGLVLNGSPFTGSHGNAGEFSAIYTTREEALSRPALQYLINDLRAHGVTVDGVEELRTTFDPNWPGVQDWIDRVLPQLSRIVIGLHGIIDPEAIVFGGQIPPALADLLIARISIPEAARYDRSMPKPSLVKGMATGEPAAKGAALLPLKKQYFL